MTTATMDVPVTRESYSKAKNKNLHALLEDLTEFQKKATSMIHKIIPLMAKGGCKVSASVEMKHWKDKSYFDSSEAEFAAWNFWLKTIFVPLMNHAYQSEGFRFSVSAYDGSRDLHMMIHVRRPSLMWFYRLLGKLTFSRF